MSRHNSKLDEIRVVILRGFENATLLIHPEDNDVWTFTLSRVWLKTIKGARETNIYSPEYAPSEKTRNRYKLFNWAVCLNVPKRPL